MKNIKICVALLLILVMPAANGTWTEAANDALFPDVLSSAWYADDLRYLLENAEQTFSGYPDGTFRPNDTLTLDMFIKLIVTAMGDKVEGTGDYWASAYIEKALEKGYIRPSDSFHVQSGGAEDTIARYKEPITREDMALITGRALDQAAEGNTCRDPLVLSSFITDYKSISDYKKGNVVKCYDLGILSGYPDGEFKPFNVLTRAEAVSVIRRLIDPRARKAAAAAAAVNPGPTPVPVPELNRPEIKDLGKGVFEVEGIRIDPDLDYVYKTNGVMGILKAEEFVNVALEYLKIYEYDGKARIKGYIPSLPEGYQWSFNIQCSVNNPDDRGYYGGTYTNGLEEQPEYKLPSGGNTFDMPLYTNKENLKGIVLDLEIKSPDGESGGKFGVSLFGNQFSTDDYYGSFDGTYPFDCSSFFEW